MPVIVRVRLHGAKQLTDSLTRLQRYLGASKPVLARAVGREGVRLLKQLTPRQRSRSRSPFSRRGFPALHTQWQLIDKGLQGAAYTVILHNKAADNPQGLAILSALEAGARPHVITGTPLAWDQTGTATLFRRRRSPAVGDPGQDVSDEFRRSRRRRGVVFTRRVRHPGHQDFRMVQETRHQLDRILAVYLQRMQAQIGAIMSGTALTVTIR